MPPIRSERAERSSIAAPTCGGGGGDLRIASVACPAAATPSRATSRASSAASAVACAAAALAAGGAVGLLHGGAGGLDHPHLALGALGDVGDRVGDLADGAPGLLGGGGHLLRGGGDAAGARARRRRSARRSCARIVVVGRDRLRSALASIALKVADELAELVGRADLERRR